MDINKFKDEILEKNCWAMYELFNSCETHDLVSKSSMFRNHNALFYKYEGIFIYQDLASHIKTLTRYRLLSKEYSDDLSAAFSKLEAKATNELKKLKKFVPEWQKISIP